MNVSYESAMVTGSHVHTCGVASFDAYVNLISRGYLEAQTRTVVFNPRRILEAWGSSMGFIVRQYMYLRRTEVLPAFQKLHDELYAPPYRASITVVVVATAHPKMLIEIAVDPVTSAAAALRASGDLGNGSGRGGRYRIDDQSTP